MNAGYPSYSASIQPSRNIYHAISLVCVSLMWGEKDVLSFRAFDRESGTHIKGRRLGADGQ